MDYSPIEEPYNESGPEDEYKEVPTTLKYDDQEAAEIAGAALSIDQSEAVPLEKYDAAKRDLTTRGDSEYVNEQFMTLAAIEAVNAKETLDGILNDPTIDQDTRFAAQFNYNLEHQGTSIVDLNKAQIEKYAAGSDKTLDEINAAYDAAHASINRLLTASEGADEEAGIMDYVGMAAPFNYNFTMHGGYRKAFPEADSYTESVWGALLPGEMSDIIIEQFQNTPRTEWPEKVELLIQGMKESSGYWGVNQAILAEKTREIAQKLSGEVEFTDLQGAQFMDNLFSMMDIGFVGGILKASVKGIGKYTSQSTIDNAARTNPEAAAELTAMSIRSEEAAKAAGTTSETAAQRLFPQWKGQDELIEDGIEEVLNRQIKEAQEVLDEGLKELNTARVFTDDEFSQVLGNFQRKMDELAGIKHSSSNSRIEVVTAADGSKQIEYGFTYVKGKNKLFDTAEEAVQAVKKHFPEAEVVVKEVNQGTRKVTQEVTHEASKETIQRRIVTAIKERMGALMTARVDVDTLRKMRDTAKASPSAKAMDAARKASKKAEEKANAALKAMEDAKLAKDVAVGMAARGEVAASELRNVNKVYKDSQKAYDKAIADADKKAEKLFGLNKAEKEASEVGDINNIRDALKKARNRAGSHAEMEELIRNLAHAENGDFQLLTGRWQNMHHRVSKPNKEKVTTQELRYGFVAEVKGTKVPSEADRIMFGDNATLEGGSWLSWLLDPASKFSRDISSFASRAVDKEAAWKGKLFDLTNSFVKLPKKSQAKVSNALLEGDKQSRVWTLDDLKGEFGLNAKEMEGYYAIRNVEDVLFRLKDHRIAQELRAKGHRWVTIGEETYAGIPRTLETALGKTDIPMFDPISGSIRKLSEDEIRQLYNGYGTLVQLDVPITRGSERVTHMVVNTSEGAVIKDVPEAGVLNKLEGHVTRYYDETYYITSARRGTVDGVESELTHVVEVAGSRKEAQEIVDRLSEDAVNGVSFDWRYDRNLNRAQSDSYDKQLMRNTGVLKHAGRGEHLRKSTAGIANIDDPVKAIQRSVDSVARTLTTDRMVTDLKRRWVNTYGDLAEGKFPNQVDHIHSASGQAQGKVDKAKRLWDYINMLEGNPTKWENTYRMGWIKVAEFLQEQGIKNKSVHELLQDIGNVTPDKFLRGVAFNLFIALNPIRQLALQSQQIFFLSGLSPKYIFNPNGLARHQSGFIVAQSDVLMAQPKMVKTAAKLMDMSVSEFKAFRKAFKDSGLVQAISSHSFSRDAIINASTSIRKSGYGHIKAAGQNFMAAATGIPRKIGFEAGEQNNIMMTYLVAWNRHKKKFPNANITDPRVADTIAQEARNMALSMNKAGELPYQKGWLANATQFLSVQHKALTMMMTNQGLTKAERMRIMAGQVAFWGTTGVGLGHAYEAARDALGLTPNPVVDDVIKSGLGEFAINEAIRFATGDDTDIDLASSYAAGGGFYDSIGALVEGFLTGSKSPVDLALGASSSAIGRFTDIYAGLTFINNRTDLTVPEKLRESAVEFSKLSSGVNNAVKMMMYNNLQMHVDKHGDPITKATFAEISAKGLLGLNAESTQEYYRMLNYKGKSVGQDEVKAEARRLYDYWKTELLTKVDAEAVLGKDASLTDRKQFYISELLQKHDTMIRHSMALYDEDFALAVQNQLYNMLNREQMENKADSLVTKIVNAALRGSSGKPIDDTINMIMRTDMPEEQKQQYIRLLEEGREQLEYVKGARKDG